MPKCSVNFGKLFKFRIFVVEQRDVRGFLVDVGRYVLDISVVVIREKHIVIYIGL